MRTITTTGNRWIYLTMRNSQDDNTAIDYKVILTNENTREDLEIDVEDWLPSDNNTYDGQLAVLITQDFNEGDEYRIKVINQNTGIVSHRNKLFVTDQTPQNYSING